MGEPKQEHTPGKLYPPVPFEDEASPVSEMYIKHLAAMTAEGLHGKAEIAWQLAARDVLLTDMRAMLIEIRDGGAKSDDPDMWSRLNDLVAKATAR